MEGIGIPLDFSFGFDDARYSDRILLLQIVDGSCSTSKRCGRRRRRKRLLKTAMTAPRVKTIHINSLILAARSPYFRKLFSNGMLESDQKNVELWIDFSEEASLMDLLKYIYGNKLPITLNALLDLLVMADKFEVASCLRECTQSLQTLPMTSESACCYLDLPMISTIQPLRDAAKLFLVSFFKDFDMFKEEVLNLTLAGFQAILSSDDLQVTSEYVVYDFVLAWAGKHYPDLKERRGILKTHLLHLIRFPFMTTTQLTQKVRNCTDIEPEVASEILIRTLTFKAETTHQKRLLAAEEANVESRQFVERAYKRRPIQVVELALPFEQCIVYLHFTREKLTNIFPEGVIKSDTFHLGDQVLVLYGQCGRPIDNLQTYHFWLVLKALGSATFRVNYDIQLRMKPLQEELKISWVKGNAQFTESERVTYIKSVPWAEFIGDDSTYFINNLLHVRAELAIKT